MEGDGIVDGLYDLVPTLESSEVCNKNILRGFGAPRAIVPDEGTHFCKKCLQIFSWPSTG